MDKTNKEPTICWERPTSVSDPHIDSVKGYKKIHHDSENQNKVEGAILMSEKSLL